MAKFRMKDGSIVNTDKAKRSWEESTRWNGNNHISTATGSQWNHETLYLSKKGRYYIVRESQWQGSSPSARYVDAAAASNWLIVAEEDLPADLAGHAESIEE